MAIPEKKNWHLEKTISVGHILTTITVAGSVLVWAMKMDSRVSVLETKSVYSQQADETMERRWQESLGRLEAMLIRIENKLDGKQDKRR